MASGERMETVAGALQEFARRGFTRDMTVAGGRLAVAGQDATYAPNEVVIRDHRRFEGASDPDDTAVVYAIETRDGVKGALVDAYNVYADPGVAAFLRAVPVAETAPDPQPARPAFERPAALPEP